MSFSQFEFYRINQIISKTLKLVVQILISSVGKFIMLKVSSILQIFFFKFIMLSLIQIIPQRFFFILKYCFSFSPKLIILFTSQV